MNTAIPLPNGSYFYPEEQKPSRKSDTTPAFEVPARVEDPFTTMGALQYPAGQITAICFPIFDALPSELKVHAVGRWHNATVLNREQMPYAYLVLLNRLHPGAEGAAMLNGFTSWQRNYHNLTARWPVGPEYTEKSFRILVG